MSDTFRDWIPADEDPGAIGDGFQDYVPPREPVLEPEETEEPIEQPIEQPKEEKKK